MDRAADYARQAGFIAPYPSQIFRFWWGGCRATAIVARATIAVFVLKR